MKSVKNWGGMRFNYSSVWRVPNRSYAREFTKQDVAPEDVNRVRDEMMKEKEETLSLAKQIQKMGLFVEMKSEKTTGDTDHPLGYRHTLSEIDDSQMMDWNSWYDKFIMYQNVYELSKEEENRAKTTAQENYKGKEAKEIEGIPKTLNEFYDGFSIDASKEDLESLMKNYRAPNCLPVGNTRYGLWYHPELYNEVWKDEIDKVESPITEEFRAMKENIEGATRYLQTKDAIEKKRNIQEMFTKQKLEAKEMELEEKRYRYDEKRLADAARRLQNLDSTRKD